MFMNCIGFWVFWSRYLVLMIFVFLMIDFKIVDVIGMVGVVKLIWFVIDEKFFRMVFIWEEWKVYCILSIVVFRFLVRVFFCNFCIWFDFLLMMIDVGLFWYVILILELLLIFFRSVFVLFWFVWIVSIECVLGE